MNTITQSLCNRWNSFLLSGFFLVLLGTIALSSVFWTTMASVMIFGVLLLAAGIASTLGAFWASEWKGFFAQLIIGILSAVVGGLILANPEIGAASITLLLAVFFVGAGLSKIAGALLLEIENWGWMMMSGLVTLALGLLILAQWPSSALWVLGLFIAIDLMITGWTSIMYALSVRKRCKIMEERREHSPA